METHGKMGIPHGRATFHGGNPGGFRGAVISSRASGCSKPPTRKSAQFTWQATTGKISCVILVVEELVDHVDPLVNLYVYIYILDR